MIDRSLELTSDHAQVVAKEEFKAVEDLSPKSLPPHSAFVGGRQGAGGGCCGASLALMFTNTAKSVDFGPHHANEGASSRLGTSA